MPNVLTHGLMAKQTQKQLSESLVLDAIKAHPKVYLFGSNGPDILYYYNVWPWLDQTKTKKFKQYGDMVHSERINDFFDTMIAIAQKQDHRNQQIMLAYIAGFICHWALDSTTHPLVFYRTGDIQSAGHQYDHFRYESALDSKITQQVFEEKLSKHPTYRYMSMESYQEKVVAFLISQAHQRVYQSDITVEECLTCMKHAKGVLRIMFDPWTLWFDVIQIFEKVILKDPWRFSSHMVIGRIDENFDELNKNQDAWFNPTDPGTQHHESFMQLFEQAIGRAKLALIALEKTLEGKIDSIGGVILDRSYDTGRSDQADMIIFNNIYK